MSKEKVADNWMLISIFQIAVNCDEILLPGYFTTGFSQRFKIKASESTLGLNYVHVIAFWHLEALGNWIWLKLFDEFNTLVFNTVRL